MPNDRARRLAGLAATAITLGLLLELGPEWAHWGSIVLTVGALALILSALFPDRNSAPSVRRPLRRAEFEVEDDPTLRLERRSVVPGGLNALPRDELTDLFDSRALTPVLAAAMREARRSRRKVAVIAFDIDRLTDINGCHGFSAGDELLRIIAERLSDLGPELVVRVTGDRFVMVLTDIENLAAAELAAAAAHDRIGRRVELTQCPQVELRPSASAGISLFPDHGDAVDQLLRKAEMAMDEAKRDGGRRFRLFDEAMIRSLRLRSELERDLARAVELDQLSLHYQAQVDLRSGKISGFEALMRWHHPERDWVPPGLFIPVAESSGLIKPIGAWLIDEACRACSHWRSLGLDLSMAINISAAQLRQHDLPGLLYRALQNHSLDPNQVELEVTESLFVDPSELVMRRTIEAVARMGVRLAIDDFGTGYSSLAYLKRLPVDRIKIDKSFISGIGDEDVDEALVRAIIGLARTFGKQVLAEGIETEAQHRFLTDEGCDQGQGFFFSRPLPEDRCMELLGRPRTPTLRIPVQKPVAS